MSPTTLWEDWSTQTAGAAPTGFTERFNTNGSWIVTAGAGKDGVSKAIQFVPGTAVTNGLSWDLLDSVSDRNVIEFVTLWSNTQNGGGGANDARTFFRGSGAAGTETCYVAGNVNTTNRVSQWVNGTKTDLNNVAYNPSEVNGWYYSRTRFDADLDMVYNKTWQFGTTEPSGWSQSIAVTGIADPAAPAVAVPATSYFQYSADNAVASYSTLTTTGGLTNSGSLTQPNAMPATSAVRPTLNTGGANGHKYLTFDAVDDRLSTSNTTGTMLAFGNNKTGLTLAAVLKDDQVGTADQYAIIFSSGGANSPRIAIGTNGSGQWSLYGRRLDADTVTALAGPAADANLHLVVGTIDYTNRTAKIYVDGTLVSTNAAFLTAGSTSATASLSWGIGSQGTPSNWWGGQIYETFGWDRALTQTEVTALANYTYNTYGVGIAPTRDWGWAGLFQNVVNGRTSWDFISAQTGGGSAPLTKPGSTSTPVVNLGPAQTVEPYTRVDIDMSASTDPVGAGLTYFLARTANAQSLTMQGSGALRYFIAPGTIAQTTYTLSGWVVDGNGTESAHVNLDITVQAVTDRAAIGGVETPMQVAYVTT